MKCMDKEAFHVLGLWRGGRRPRWRRLGLLQEPTLYSRKMGEKNLSTLKQWRNFRRNLTWRALLEISKTASAYKKACCDMMYRKWKLMAFLMYVHVMTEWGSLEDDSLYSEPFISSDGAIGCFYGNAQGRSDFKTECEPVQFSSPKMWAQLIGRIIQKSLWVSVHSVVSTHLIPHCSVLVKESEQQHGGVMEEAVVLPSSPLNRWMIPTSRIISVQLNYDPLPRFIQKNP